MPRTGAIRTPQPEVGADADADLDAIAARLTEPPGEADPEPTPKGDTAGPDGPLVGDDGDHLTDEQVETIVTDLHRSNVWLAISHSSSTGRCNCRWQVRQVVESARLLLVTSE